jgi:hypothetical protein
MKNLRHFFFLSVELTPTTGAGDGSGFEVAGVCGGSALTIDVSIDSAVLVVDTGLRASSLISSIKNL